VSTGKELTDTQELIRFGTFELNLSTEELRKSGTLIKLSPQPFKLLVMLAHRSGQIVTREEIQQTLWEGGTYVDFEQGMNHCVKQIRNALSDSADSPLYVETVPRRGYRFLAPVVTKTIHTPAPRVVESESGIKPGPHAPGNEPVGPRGAARPLAVTDPTAALRTQPTPAATVAPPQPLPATSTGSASKAGPTDSRSRLIVIGVAIGVLIAVIVGIFYWRSHKSAVLTEKDTIVLADFDNTTGEANLDNALKQALREQLSFLNVLPVNKVKEELQFMGLPADTKLSEEVALGVCQRSGSKAVLQGSIAGIGDQYKIGLKAFDCTGEELATEQADANGRNQVLPALSKATRRMREKLGEGLASVQKYDAPAEDATTPSLDAWKAYGLGVKAADAEGYAAAIPYFKNAIDLDPNFAMAYARLGTEYYNLNQPSLAVEYTTKAYQLRDHAGPREKIYITSHYHDMVSGNLLQAIASYRLLQEAYPREVDSYLDLNSDYNTIGNYPEALAQARKALDLDPKNSLNYHNLILSYLYLNRLHDAQAVLDQAEARKLAIPALLPDFYEIAFLRGDAAAMQQYVADAAGKPGMEDVMLSLHSDTEAYFGRLQKARQLTQAARDSAAQAGSKEAAATWILTGALHDAEIGDPRRARQDAEQALATSQGQTVTILAALVLARSGDAKRAGTLADQLVKRYPTNTIVNDYWVPTIRAAIDLDEKNPAAAIEALQRTTPYEAGAPPPGTAFYPVYLRGLAYLQLGQGPQAVAEFQKMLKYPSVVLNLTTAALAHLQLARAQAMSGDKAAARKSYEEFLSLWKDADKDLATLKQGQAEYAKLQ